MTNKELENKINALEKELQELKEQIKRRNKITLKEFWKSKEELAIHCDTEEKANILLTAFDKMGKKWSNGKKYTDSNYYEFYDDKICYSNDACYCDVRYNDIYIYEFEDVDLTILLEHQFSEDEKTILRNIDKEWKWIARDKTGGLYLYYQKPSKDGESWNDDANSAGYIGIFPHLFQSIKWEDEEPVEIAKVIGE